MPNENTRIQEDADTVVDQLLDNLGRSLVVALPLGLGKPVVLVNALYRRAKTDPSIDLTLLTALSLARPAPSGDLRGRFLEPVYQRVFADVPALDYVADLDSDAVPDNITIKEFYVAPGSRLGNFHSQSHYISSNYTHAARDAFHAGCNVVMQMVAARDQDGTTQLSMSCNADTSAELIDLLRESGRPHLAIAVVNQQLPYMCGDAEVSPSFYDVVLQGNPHNHGLFPLPKLPPIDDIDYLIGLNASCLVPDNGTLQIGIGAMGDAIAYSLCLRQKENTLYKDALARIGTLTPQNHDTIQRVGGIDRFRQGLYGATEMFVEGFIQLLKAGVLKREVYDFWALQMLINEGRCDPERLDGSVLEGMSGLGVREIRGKDFAILQHHGLFNAETCYQNGYITTPDGTRIAANMADPHSQRVMAKQCLGKALRNGRLLHGGFFLGSGDFYQSLRDMPEEMRRKINMTGVYKVNQLDHNPRLYKAQRRNARFINTGLKATLNGAVASDTLQSGQVLSGVGGQYNFVAMAHQLPGGRSVLMIRSVRETSHHVESNIVWEYGACTIPRHLRDIVVTEYGIADIRGKSDSEVIKALLNIADSRFQPNLLASAVSAGKIEPGYQIPPQHRDNNPNRLHAVLAQLRERELFPRYPFGCDFTDEELQVGSALKALAARRDTGLLRLLIGLLVPNGKHSDAVEQWLALLGVTPGGSIRERITRRLLSRELKRVLQ